MNVNRIRTFETRNGRLDERQGHVKEEEAWVFLLKRGFSRRACNLWLRPRNISDFQAFFFLRHAHVTFNNAHLVS